MGPPFDLGLSLPSEDGCQFCDPDMTAVDLLYPELGAPSVS